MVLRIKCRRSDFRGVYRIAPAMQTMARKPSMSRAGLKFAWHRLNYAGRY